MTVCTKCSGEPVVYSRRYSGESLCAGCFTGSLEEKVRKTVSRYEMLKRGDRVGVAVSGGKDSLSLLKMLSGQSDRMGLTLVALSVDEGVEGYRDEALEHAARLAGDLGVEHITVSYKDLFDFSLDEALSRRAEDDPSSCSFCGVFRRRAIDEAGAQASVDVIATAHNLDDFVQTFMMNLLHGDVDRLGWLGPNHVGEGFNVRRVKPFMEVYEEEIALFAYLKGIPFQSVSCPYMHEGLRSEVRDYLNQMEAAHPGMKNVLFNSSLEVISRFGASAKSVVACSVCGRPSTGDLCNVCRMTKKVKGSMTASPVGTQARNPS